MTWATLAVRRTYQRQNVQNELIGNEQLSIEIQSTIAKFHFFPSFNTYLLFVPLIFLLLFYLETIRPF